MNANNSTNHLICIAICNCTRVIFYLYSIWSKSTSSSSLVDAPAQPKHHETRPELLRRYTSCF
ncbi:hypothetical protein Hanom_Chr14g01247841 [Helianthus anomalus]